MVNAQAGHLVFLPTCEICQALRLRTFFCYSQRENVHVPFNRAMKLAPEVFVHVMHRQAWMNECTPPRQSYTTTPLKGFDTFCRPSFWP